MKMSAMDRLERLIALARRAEDVAQGLEREYNERRRERSARCLPSPSPTPIQSQIQTSRHSMHYQTQGNSHVNQRLTCFITRHLSHIQTHATPTSTSSGTPVRDMMCLASSPTGRILPRSSRP